MNNPLRFIDPDGREIAIAIGNNKNGTVNYLTYRGGKLYSGDKEYKGDDKFAQKILNTLNTLVAMNDSKINEMISTLESNTGRVHMISKSSLGKNSVGSDDPIKSNLGEQTGSQIRVTLSGEPLSNGLETTPETSMAHELSHAYDFDQGKMKGYYGEINTPPSLKASEKRAIKSENRVRNKQGIKERTKY